jgi:hypothetical protein
MNMRLTKLFQLLFCVGLMRFSIDGSDGGGGGGSGGQGGQGGQGGGQGGSGSTPPEPETFSKDYVRELRAENKGWRLKAQELEAKANEAAETAKKAKEEADGTVSAGKKAADERIIRAELKAEAIKAGLVDMDALKLADLTKVTLKDDGTVEGAEALFADLKKAKPYLFGAASSSSGQKPPPSGDPAPKSVKDMPKADYEKAKREALKSV